MAREIPRPLLLRVLAARFPKCSQSALKAIYEGLQPEPQRGRMDTAVPMMEEVVQDKLHNIEVIVLD